MKKVLLIGEPLIRLTPTQSALLGNAVDTRMYYGGSEVNIACNLAAFGMSTKLLTALPENAVGDRFCDFLRSKQIDVSSVMRVGERLGLYYMENGFGSRNSRVYYDRMATSFSLLDWHDLDATSIFQDVGLVHFSGISLAVSKQVEETIAWLLEEAKQRKIAISFDLNWRAKMMALPDAKRVFSRFAHYADYCFGIEPLMQDAFDTDLFARAEATESTVYKRMQALKDVYQFRAIFHSLRTVDSCGQNTYQAYALGDEFCISQKLQTAVLQRVGSGDAFVSGALYQLLHQASLQETVDFAVASGTLKCTYEGDHMVASVEEVAQLLMDKRDVQR